MKKLMVLLVVVMAAAVFGEERLALVIANVDYDYAGELRGADSDAELMADTLRRVGFTVESVYNADLDGIRSAVTRFADDLAGAQDAVGFFYYAGYAFQAGRKNYLVPIDSRLQGREAARREAYPVDDLLSSLEGSGAGLNIVVLDACRELPTAWAGSGAMGLAAPSRPPRNHIVMFSAGGSAYEIQSGVFVEELAGSLRSSDAEIKDLLHDVADSVAAATGRRQRPALSVNFTGNYYVTGNGARAAEPRQAQARQRRDAEDTAVAAAGEEAGAESAGSDVDFTLEFKASLGIMAGYNSIDQKQTFTDGTNRDWHSEVGNFFATPVVANLRVLLPVTEHLRFGLGLEMTWIFWQKELHATSDRRAAIDMNGVLAPYVIVGYGSVFLHAGYDFGMGGPYIAPFIMLTDHLALGATFTFGSNKMPGIMATMNQDGFNYTKACTSILAGLSVHWVF